MPGGFRVIYRRAAWHERSRLAVCTLAHSLCEGCEVPHPLPWPKGQCHHRYGRGGGRRDDRPLIPMQSIETEANLARWRWYRNLIWACKSGHDRVERLSTAEYRRGLKQFCECGLLKI
jgi:hypothetical protein